jgi:hypothetical protein
MKTFILSAALGIAALCGVTSLASAADGEIVLPSAGVQTDTQATTQVRYGYGWGNRGYYGGYYGGYRPYYRSYYRPYYNNYYGGYGPYYGNGVYIGRGGVRIGF